MLHKKSLDRIEAGLYVLATPIGNLKDITLRTLEVLSAVDLVAAEDTRITRNLLAHYGIEAKIVSLREHNEASQSGNLIALMRDGQSVALVTDAGTPGISDPGGGFVGRAREAGISVWSLPGPSALTCAIAGLGWDIGTFCFHGFPPAQAGARQRMLAGLRDTPHASVFYEAPHRIAETLRDVKEIFGAGRRCAVFRELTKKFEQFHQGSADSLHAWVLENDNHRRGEFVLVVAGSTQEALPAGPDPARVMALLCEKLPTRDAVRIAAELTGRKRNELYDLALQHKPGGSAEDKDDD